MSALLRQYARPLSQNIRGVGVDRADLNVASLLALTNVRTDKCLEMQNQGATLQPVRTIARR
jgi:hypothetical protein